MTLRIERDGTLKLKVKLPNRSDDAGLRVRRRLEAVREGLSLSGNLTTVRDRPNVVGQSGKMTESVSALQATD